MIAKALTFGALFRGSQEAPACQTGLGQGCRRARFFQLAASAARQPAVLIDMALLPEPPPAIAKLKPAPDVAMAQPSHGAEPVVQDEPLPDLPEKAVVPDMPALQSVLKPQLADLPPDAEAPSEPPKPVVEEKVKPVETPLLIEKPQPNKAREKPVATVSQKPQIEQKAASAASSGQIK